MVDRRNFNVTDFSSFKNKTFWKIVFISAICCGLIYFYYRVFYRYIPFLTHSGDILFGADTDKRIFTYYIRGRHFLHFIISIIFDKLFYTFLDPFYSAKLISAIMGSVASLVIFFICYKISLNFFISISLFLAYALSATVLIFSSIPESFMTTAFMTNLLILAYLFSDVTKIKSCIILAIVTALSFLASGHHLITIAFTTLYIFLKNFKNNKFYIRHTLVFLLTCFLSILLPVLLCNIFIRIGYKDFLLDIRRQLRFVRLSALFDYNSWKYLLTNFFLFSISPPDCSLTPRGMISIKSIVVYFIRLPGLGFIITYGLLLLGSIKNIYDHRHIICHNIWVVYTLGLIYLVSFAAFDVPEAFTFSSFFIFLPISLIAQGIAFVKSRSIYFILSLFILFVSINNILFLNSAVNHIVLKMHETIK